MLQTPLHAWHVANGGRMVPFAGWDMPVQYSTITAEHTAVRTAAGLFDISHMGRLRLSGPDAVPLAERLVTSRVATLKTGQIRYGLVTNESGGVLDDILVYRLDEQDLGLVVNASNRQKVIDWISRHAADFDATLADDTFATGMVALQGPAAADVLARHVDFRVAELRYYRCRQATVCDVPAVVSRTGYTGEDGFEFIVEAEWTERLWERLLLVGREKGVVPCGLGCRDTLRLEAAMPLYGHELTETTDPLSAGLAFAVALDKEFVGRDAIATVAERGPERIRVGLKLAGKRIAREGTPLYAGPEQVGEVTSGTFSPTLGFSLATGYVCRPYADPGTPLEADLRGKREPATVVELPFYRRP